MKNTNTRFLTGIRGYSALAVFLIHSGGGLREVGAWANKWVDLGKYGVISFFVLSALTLAISIGRSRTFDYSHYLLRRFVRIFPMYSIAIVIFWGLGGVDSYQKMFGVSAWDPYDLFVHLTFLNLWDVRYQNTVIGIEWTVPIEMWTYLIIPPLFFWMKQATPRQQWMAFFAALILSIVARHWHDEELGAHWAVETYLYCFIGGIITYGYMGKIKLSAARADNLVVLLLVLALFPLGGGRVLDLWFTMLVMGLILILPCACRTRWIFENRAIVFIGNVSFPFYLLHFPIIHYLLEQHYPLQMVMMVGLTVTAGGAYLCHVLIEKPILGVTGRQHPYDA